MLNNDLANRSPQNLPKPENSRLLWIDTLRFLSVFWIFVIHFMTRYYKEYTIYFREGWSSLIVKGITGKLCVALFCILLGYFAAQAPKKQTSLSRYAGRRYFQFIIPLGISNVVGIIYMLILSATNADLLPAKLSQGSGVINVAQLIKSYFSDTFTFTANIVSTYWCMDSFFIGSMLVFLLAKAVEDKAAWIKLGAFLSAYGIAYASQNTWVANCILGGVFWAIINIDFAFLKKWYVLIPLAAALPFLYRWRKESVATYMLYGIASLIFVLICYYSSPIQRVLSIKRISVLGLYAFEIFLVHPLVHRLFTDYLFEWITRYLSLKQSFFVTFPCTVLVCAASAYCLKKLCYSIEKSSFVSRILACI